MRAVSPQVYFPPHPPPCTTQPSTLHLPSMWIFESVHPRVSVVCLELAIRYRGVRSHIGPNTTKEGQRAIVNRLWWEEEGLERRNEVDSQDDTSNPHQDIRVHEPATVR
jgi:hypothetical protein